MKTADYIKHYAISHTGKARRNNEDYFLTSDQLNLYILADGIGGHNYGEVAAKMACEVILEKFEQVNALSSILDVDTALSVMKFAIYSANRAIYQMTLNETKYQGMGTTVIVFFKLNKHIILGHVGDSRCYQATNKLTLLTQDHTIFLQKSPKTRSLRGKHYLTKSVGLKEFIEPSIQLLKYDPHANYLLCSDGLSDYLEEDKIKSLLINNDISIEDKSEFLLSSALNTPAKDNITFILIPPEDVKK